MSKDWVIPPGTPHNPKEAFSKPKAPVRHIHSAEELEGQLGELIRNYLEDVDEDKKVVCLADNNEVIYFAIFPEDEDEEMIDSDAAILYPTTGEYRFLPKHLGKELVKYYLAHISTLADAYKYLEEKGE